MNSQFGPQPDGSIVDIYGRAIPSGEKRHILETVHSLPAREKQDDFLHAISNNRVIIVQGETGSGKTTQLPKFAHQADPTKRIVVTQPRVLSAKSNAGRVSDELLVETGNAQRYSLGIGVGYRTGPEKNSTKDTRFLFNTDATEVLRQVVSGLIPDLLFLDEVHNFSTHTEVAAMVARKRADAMSIVIMSATLDPEIFREYFKGVSRDIPLIQIPGRTFGVETDYDAPGSYMTKMSELVRAKKNILFFAPGKKEIEGHIEEFHKQFGGNVMIFPLHSEMPRSEQDKLLKKHGDKPYIIVSTNVAEESITIPYIDAVVDLGTHKVMRYDQFGNPTLFLEDTAYANAKQRAGRSGRTKPGEYFRFNFTPSSELLEYPEAPIEKEMIDRQILALLAQGTDIIELVEMQKETGESPFFHSVNTNLFDISLGRLLNIGALTKEYKLTELGYELLKFPVDVYHARMLYEAISRGTLDTIIPMVAILEKKGFVSKDSLWKEFLTKESYSSDLVGYHELFQIVTSPTLSRKHERLLIEHGADPLEIADFRERDNGIKLYEVVDLSCIGIKNKKVKEIDEAITLLKTHISGMISEGEGQKTQDSKSVKISMTSGYMHALYIYDGKTKKFYNKDQKDGPGFYLGNVSLIEPVDGKIYLGVPFVIGGSDGLDDFPVLTHIASVDENSIKEARSVNGLHSQREYVPKRREVHHQSTHESHQSTPGIGQARSTPAKKHHTDRGVSAFHIVVDYDLALREFQDERHDTVEDAQLFYLRYCLIPFLFGRNKHLRNYIDGKSEEWVQYFSMLLVSFLEKHDLYRVNPKNIPRTEASFRDDADILRRFQDSSDSLIKSFRLSGIPDRVTRVLKGGITEDVIDKSSIHIPVSDELNILREEYSRLIGEAKLYSRPIALDAIAAFALKEEIKELSRTGEYAELHDAFLSASSYGVHDLQEMMKKLKGMRDKKRDEHKAIIRLSELERFEQIFQSQESILGAKDSILLDAMNRGYFGYMDTAARQGYRQFIQRIKSPDKRKNKRAMRENGLSYYQSKLSRHIQAERAELAMLKEEVSLTNFPLASKVLGLINKIGRSIYEDNYYNTVLKEGAFDFMRSILRDSITEQKGLDRLLFEGFLRKGCGEHLKEKGASFRELVHHVDLMEVAEESYGKTGPIYTSIMTDSSSEDTTRYVEKLEQLIERMKNSSRVIDKNNLFSSFRGVKE